MPEDIALFRAEMAAWPGAGELREWQEEVRDWVDANNGCRREILERLRADGPLPTSKLPDTCVVPWASSGWNNNRNLRMMLDKLVQRGEVAAAGGPGRHRLWDLASRIYPDDPVPPLETARRLLDERRLSGLGIARPSATKLPVVPIDVGEAGEPAVVEGVRAPVAGRPGTAGSAVRRSRGVAVAVRPVAADRKRLAELFEFDHIVETYKPAAARRWGYYALPILYGDRLVGKLDAQADYKAGVLRVQAVHQDVQVSKTLTSAVGREITDLARWLDLDMDRRD